MIMHLDTSPSQCHNFDEEANSNDPPATVFSSHSAEYLALPETQGHCFESVKEIKQKVTPGVMAIPKDDFQVCFQE